MNGLKYIRNRCNLSLSELASALGVTRQALSLWETEKKPIPTQRKNSWLISLESHHPVSETDDL